MRRVDPKAYTKKYYLEDCSGYSEFRKGYGKILEPRLERIVKEIPSVKEKTVLDIGCGRGEMVFWAARNNAKKVIGIDYSKNAIDLAKKAKKKQPKKIQSKIEFYVMDAKKIQFPKNSADAIFLIEVLEHLYLEEQQKALSEISKVLKDNGFVFVHTSPSRWFNDYGYRFWCYPVSTAIVNLWNTLTNRKYSNLTPWGKLRSKWHKLMHINEPDYFSLKRLFNRSKFIGSIKSTNVTVLKPETSWKDKLYNVLVYLYPISNYPPFNIIMGNDYYVILKKK